MQFLPGHWNSGRFPEVFEQGPLVTDGRLQSQRNLAIDDSQEQPVWHGSPDCQTFVKDARPYGEWSYARGKTAVKGFKTFTYGRLRENGTAMWCVWMVGGQRGKKP